MYPRRTSSEQRFRVTLGHVEVVVECRTRDEALRLARRRLSQEHPRLWDVIYRVEERQFRVDPAA